MKEKEVTNRAIFALVATIVGISNLMVGIHVGTIFLMVIGAVALIVAWAFCFHMVWTLTKLEKIKKLKQQKRGALWIWIVCLLALVVLAIGWFTLTWPTFMLIDVITANYSFPAEVQPAIDLIKTIFGWFLILMSLGLLLWAYVASQRREDVTYPY